MPRRPGTCASSSGQADRFREGLERSSQWEAHIAQTFASQGLPPELAVLPHVESSFDPTAYSKVGAAGLWQFMRSTGRRYLRIDDAVDERMDPFRATEAAAQLLDYNYRVPGHLAAGADRLQPRRGRHAPRRRQAGHHRHRQDHPQLQQRELRLRLAQFLSVIPGGADHRPRPGQVLPESASGARK